MLISHEGHERSGETVSLKIDIDARCVRSSVSDRQIIEESLREAQLGMEESLTKRETSRILVALFKSKKKEREKREIISKYISIKTYLIQDSRKKCTSKSSLEKLVRIVLRKRRIYSNSLQSLKMMRVLIFWQKKCGVNKKISRHSFRENYWRCRSSVH